MMLRFPVLAVVAAAAVCLQGCEAAPLAAAEAAGTGLARRSYYEPIVRAVAEGGRWAKAAFNRATAPVTGAGKYSVRVSDEAAAAAAAGNAAKVTDDFAAAAGNAAKVADDPAHNVASHLDIANAARFEEKVIKAQTNLFNAKFLTSVDDAEESALLAREALDDAVKAGNPPAVIEELTAVVKEADNAVLLAKNPRPIAALEADLFKAKRDLATFRKLDRERANLIVSVRTTFDSRVNNQNAAAAALLRAQREAAAKGTKPQDIEALRAAVDVEEMRMQEFLGKITPKLAKANADLKSFLDAANKGT